MIDLVPTSYGKEGQQREFYLNEILKAFPEKATDPDLIYGNVELVYFRMINDGRLKPPTQGSVVITTNVNNLGLTVQPKWKGA